MPSDTAMLLAQAEIRRSKRVSKLTQNDTTQPKCSLSWDSVARVLAPVQSLENCTELTLDVCGLRPWASDLSLEQQWSSLKQKVPQQVSMHFQLLLQQSAISFWFYRKEVEIIIYKFAASFPCIAYKITESEKDPGLTVSATKLTSIFCWQEQLTARKTNRRTGEFWQDKFIKDQFWSKFSCLFVPWCPIEGCNLLPLKICCPWKSHSNHPFCSVSIAHWHSCPIMLHDSSQTTLSALFAYSKKLLHRYTKPVQSFSNIHWKLILHAKMIWYAYYATPARCCIQPGINQSIVTICIDSAMLC